MPGAPNDVNKGTDPSVAKQWDDQTSTEQKFKDFYEIVDNLNIGMMGTYRNGTGPVGRAMAVAKRTGPDFLFLANANSQKFDDIESNKITNLYFHDSSSQDWVSVTGDTVTSRNDDPRIKEVWTKMTSAWFGDLGDGTHTGGPEDPRMKLIEVQPKYISYWKHQTSSQGFKEEIDEAIKSGKVAAPGSLRQMTAEEIKDARSKHSDKSS